MNDVSEKMRADWNERAGEDAYYYVAFGRREQDDEEFFATAADVIKGLVVDLKRVRNRDAALEIGCGPGRLMRPLSRHFAEIHGVDVSDEMIRLAAERLRGGMLHMLKELVEGAASDGYLGALYFISERLLGMPREAATDRDIPFSEVVRRPSRP